MPTNARLSLDLARHNECVVIMAVGTIDRTTVTKLRGMLLAALVRETRSPLLDLTGVDRIDQVGLEALHRTASRARALGGRLRLIGLRRDIAEKLRMITIRPDGSLKIYQTLAEATRDQATG